ncbi:MAG: hypothetical protein ACK4NC_07325 [Candidatus Gracilibacteria bacterium]
MLAISCFAIGRVSGKLDPDNKLIRVGDETVPVTYNRSFSTWLSHLSPEELRCLTDHNNVYAILPKTKSHSPYLVYELIGVDHKEKEPFEKIFICGKVFLHNPVYSYSLIRITKADSAFVVRVDIPNELLTLDSLENCYVNIQGTRKKTAIVAESVKVLALPNDSVKIIYQDDYISTTGYLLDYDLDRYDYCLVKLVDRPEPLKLYRFSHYLSYSQPFCEEVRNSTKEEILSKYKDTPFKIRARRMNGRMLVKMIKPL